LSSGEAQIYHNENLYRESLYNGSTIKNVEVPPFTCKPHLLFFDDITPNPDEYQNKGIAERYGKESVRLATP